nr:MAG TPA: Arcadin 1 [Caudoviricetes sp.]
MTKFEELCKEVKLGDALPIVIQYNNYGNYFLNDELYEKDEVYLELSKLLVRKSASEFIINSSFSEICDEKIEVHQNIMRAIVLLEKAALYDVRITIWLTDDLTTLQYEFDKTE